jgi:hypothetical protein
MEGIVVSVFAVIAQLADSLRPCLTVVLRYIGLIYNGKMAVTLQMPQFNPRCPPRGGRRRVDIRREYPPLLFTLAQTLVEMLSLPI